MIRFINDSLLDGLSAEAKANPRLRKNYNFHASSSQPSQRMLNAIEPGSYVMPHRHLDPDKSETMVVLRGVLGLVTFNDGGDVLEAVKVSAGGTPLGMDIPFGTWHSVLALVPGTVFYEARGGPYLPLTAEEKAPWAPAEGDPAAAAYLARLLGALG